MNDQPQTLIELLRLRASERFDRVVYTFLADGPDAESSLTYGELDRQARAIAAWLQPLVTIGERVLLLYPPGLEYISAFFGCLYAGVIAIPAYPPRRNRSLRRLEAIVEDAQATVALTTASILSRVAPLLSQNPYLQPLRWLTSDSIEGCVEDDWREPNVSDDTLAFLQYTSGSTSTAKGVMVSHRNLLHNEAAIQKAFRQTEDSVILGWLPMYHDMGLIGNVIQPLYLGARCYLMSPVAFLQKPFRWLQALSQYQATTSGGPNFAYELCVRKTSLDQRETLDLSTWSVAFNGAEPIRHDTMERFALLFAPCGFRRQAFSPCYGLAEATLLVSGGGSKQDGLPVNKKVSARELERDIVVEAEPDCANTRVLVSCGVATGEQKVIVVHCESMIECGPHEIGEIWIAGPSVAQGYWNRPDETTQTFRARLASSDEGAFLRTGDLGFLQDGELFVTGRLKDLIIIRGLNHYPQDIEFTVERCHPALRPGCGAALAIEAAGEERLIVVQEVEHRKPVDFKEVFESIRQAVALEHELQVYGAVLIEAGTIPKTSSGKIQRHACRLGFFEGSLKEVARSILEESLSEEAEISLSGETLVDISDDEERRQRLIDYLQVKVARTLMVDPSLVDTEKSLIVLGLDSLMALELKNRIESDLKVVLSLKDFLRDYSIANITAQVLEQLKKGEAASTVASTAEHSLTEYPLSSVQQSLWFIHQLAPDSPAYHINFAARIVSALDKEALGRALQALVDRHASLRTTFSSREGQPVQRVDVRASVCFEERDASGLNENDLASCINAEGHRPFDLEEGPLFRVCLLTRSETEYILLLSVHHIVFDGWSLWVLLDELNALYSAEKSGRRSPLSPLSLQFSDYVNWQSELLDGPKGERLWSYWQRELSGELPVLNLPHSRPRPSVQTFNGASYSFKLSVELIEQLKSLAKSEGATLYMVLLAAFQILLYRYTGQEDILVGSPTSARSQAGYEGLVGCFFNAVVLRARLTDKLSFKEFLQQVRQTVLRALEHQEYPTHLLAERLQPTRDPSRPPLFQVSFIWQKPQRQEGATSFTFVEETSGAETDGLAWEFFPLERKFVRTDLELEMIEAGRNVTAALQYNTDLFETAAMMRMAAHFQQLLNGIVADPEQHLADLPLLTEVDRHHLLMQWSQTGKDYAADICVHELFEEQVKTTPQKVAAVYQDEAVTFQQLNEQANKLAHLLRRLTR